MSANDQNTIAELQEIIQKSTGQPLGPNDPFVSLGLNSLQATELALELADHMGEELPPSLMAPESTLSRLAAHLRGEDAAAAADPSTAEPTAASSFRSRLSLHQDEIERLRAADLLCYGQAQEGMASATDIVVDGREMTVFSSYSYLALNRHPEVLSAKSEAIRRFGSGTHAVMLLGGYTGVHQALEDTLAANYRCEDAVLYSSGYAANMAVIDTLMTEDDVIFCDMLVHTSILDGCRLSGAQIHMFPHQDAGALDRMLARRPAGAETLVIVDGVYSLRGEIADLPAIVRTAHAHDALVMVDEAHALGAIGNGGRGTAAHHGVEGEIDIVTGGLGKGIPAYGGYVAADRERIEYLRFRSRPYVFSGGMDVGNAAAARVALRLLEQDPSLMSNLTRNIDLMQTELARHGVPCLTWDSPCMPVLCGSAENAYAASAQMRRRGFYIAPITYPAVPRDQQGLRLTVTAAHTPQQIQNVVRALAEVMATGVTARAAQQPFGNTTTYERSHSMGSNGNGNGNGNGNATSGLSDRRRAAIIDAIEAFRAGRFLLVSDDEDRENEGDLVIAAEHATPAALNFMITHGKGLVCLALTEALARQKKLGPMVERNEDHLGTAFTVSVDGSPEHGITTGISAPDRAKTIELLISEDVGPEALRAPGHMFPLVAKPGGVQERRGHTEAGVELARLAGCAPAAVIVEVIKENGEMARRPELVVMAETYSIPYITIQDLCSYLQELETVPVMQATREAPAMATA